MTRKAESLLVEMLLEAFNKRWGVKLRRWGWEHEEGIENIP